MVPAMSVLAKAPRPFCWWKPPCSSSAPAEVQAESQNPIAPYNVSANLDLPLPAPLAYPFYSAVQSGQCNAYIPNGDTLSRSVSGLCSCWQTSLRSACGCAWWQ